MKLVIMTCNSMSSNVVYKDLIEDRHKDIKAIIIAGQVSGDLFKRMRIYFKFFDRMSFKFFIYKLVESPVWLLYANVKKWIGSRKGKNLILMKDLAKKYGIPHHKIKDINSEEAIEFIKSLEPDLILCYSSPILKKGVLAIPKIACLNCHGSLLPVYKGAAQYVWYLIKGEKVGGTSIQFMDIALDKGKIIQQEKFDIEEYDTAYSLHYKIAKAGSRLFPKVINAFEKGNVAAIGQQGEGNYYAIPTKEDMKNFRWGKLIKLRDLELI